MTVPIENRSVALGTCRMRLAQSYFFSLFTNNVRTAVSIGMGEALIDVFPPREDDDASWESIGGTWHMLIAIDTILIFSPFANSVRTAGSIGMGEALIDVTRRREDDSAH